MKNPNTTATWAVRWKLTGDNAYSGYAMSVGDDATDALVECQKLDPSAVEVLVSLVTDPNSPGRGVR